MIVEQNGIKLNIEITQDGDLEYQVLDQTAEFTEILRNMGIVLDEETGLSLRSNKHPSFSLKEKRFYVRGTGSQKYPGDRVVRAKFGSTAEARSAREALLFLISQVKPENMNQAIDVVPGGTSDCRMAIITRSQATTLSLTGHKLWPLKRRWEIKGPAALTDKGIVANPQHWNEHIGQLVDVLNKAHGYKTPDDEDIVNPHKVDTKSAKAAYRIIQEAFDQAEKDGPKTLVALWRIVSGLRAPDITEEEDLENKND